jgi:hypothetical protein
MSMIKLNGFGEAGRCEDVIPVSRKHVGPSSLELVTSTEVEARRFGLGNTRWCLREIPTYEQAGEIGGTCGAGDPRASEVVAQ